MNSIETISDSSIKIEAMTAYQSILEEGKIEGIIKALNHGKFTLTEISEDFEVTIEFVLKIKNENGI